jgi:outer membrane protein assembly factor BamB
MMVNCRSTFFLFFVLLCGTLAVPYAVAGDWPTYQFDYARSGVTDEPLGADPGLIWRFESSHTPRPAWPEPARSDYYHGITEMRALIVHDRAFHVVVANKTAFFGSTVDDKVYALNCETGEIKWTFFTGGPIRLAPTIDSGRLYVGSDDGCVYCLSIRDGSLLWQYGPDPGDRVLPGNERLISIWPVRAGLVVDDGKVYFGTGLFPNEGVWLHALDAGNGSELWKQKVLTSDGQAGRERASMSGQGYMLASENRLYVPAGRVPPMVFSRADGSYLGAVYGVGGAYGGSFSLLTTEGLVSGPGGYLKGLHITNTKKITDTIAVFNGALRMVVKGAVAYVHSESDLTAFNRERDVHGDVDAKQNLWQVDSDYAYAMIMAGETIFSGSQDKVTAYRAADGQTLWSKTVDGRAYGLAAAAGKLFVSTDRGWIYCFGVNAAADPVVVRPPTKRSPYPDDALTALYAKAAQQIVNRTGITKGYCLDVGCGEGRLAHELARITDLQILGLEEDTDKVEQARTALDEAGLYGRVSVRQGNPTTLGLTGHLFNLIVSDRMIVGGDPPVRADALVRVLRPCGGRAILGYPERSASELRETKLKRWVGDAEGTPWRIVNTLTPGDRDGLWAVLEKGKLAGAGKWTHQYADPGNSANAGDKRITESLEIQWFGRPGPGRMADRHSRAPSPVSANGRLFVRGEQILYGVDAYNGTMLWEKEVPQMETRVNMLRDCGYMAADDDHFYAAIQDKCHRFDGDTGAVSLSYALPEKGLADKFNWGLVAYEGNTLIGSAVAKNTFYNDAKGPWYDGAPNPEHYKICSDLLFACDKSNGKPIWDYEGVIMHSAIAIGAGNIYFVENRNPVVVKSPQRRIGMEELWQNLYLVRLDALTGKVEWEHPVEFMNGTVVFYLSYADNTLVVMSSNYEAYCYKLYAFDAVDGRPLWEKKTDYTGGHHGGHMQHPVIIGDVIYQQPSEFDLRSGKKGALSLGRGGGGCGGLSGTDGFLFGRGSTPQMYDLSKGGKNKRLCAITRPGCWINIVCANGLVLMPEGGSGCACAYPLQTSMAFAPRE